MSDLRVISLRHHSLLNAISTRALDKAGTAEGTNANTIKTVNSMDFSIAGQLYVKAATDNIALVTGGSAFAAQADLTTSYSLLCIDSSGNVRMVQGIAYTNSTTTATSLSTRSGNGGASLTADATALAALVVPDCPSGYCPFAVLKLVTSGGTFTPGATDLSGAGVTGTFYDIALIPTSLPA